MVRSSSRTLEFCQSNSIIWYSLCFLKKYLHPVIKFGPHLYQYASQFRFLNLVNLLFFVAKLLDSNEVLFQYLDNLLRNYYYKPWNIPYIACRKITFRSFIQSWSHYWCCRTIPDQTLLIWAVTPSKITRILELTYIIKVDNKTKKIIHTGDGSVKDFTI